MNKLLIVNPDFSGYATSIGRAFGSKGISFDILKPKRNGFVPFLSDTLLPKIGIRVLSERRKDFFKRKLLKQLKENKYDTILFIFDDVVVDKKTLNTIRSNHGNVKLSVWLYDNIKRRSRVIPILNSFDLIFTFQRSDISIIKNNCDKPVYYLPLFFDPEYYRYENLQKTIDICFIGAWNGENYVGRREMLIRLASISRKNGYKFIVKGKASIFNTMKYLRDLYFANGFRKFVSSGHLSHKSINKLYNRSKIIVNYPVDSQMDGYPIRTFEVSGSGNLLLSKNMVGLDLLFDIDQDMIVFDDFDDMEVKIEKILSKDITVETGKGLLEKLSKHSVDARVEFIIDKLNQISL